MFSNEREYFSPKTRNFSMIRKICINAASAADPQPKIMLS
jgi:hypothetical protein